MKTDTERSAAYLTGLVREFCKLPSETEWVEFKVDDARSEDIGEYLSALANGAALAGKAFAYVVWGVENGTQRIVGTHFAPRTQKIGNEELENWLLRLLEPRVDFRFFEVVVDGRRLVLLQVGRAFRQPVRFQG